METRLCKRCGQIKPLDEFTVKSNSKSGHGYWCKACHAAACQDWRNRNGQILPRRKFTDEQIAEWKAYVLEHGSIKEAAAYFGIVAGTMQKYVCDELQAYKAKRNAKIIELRNAEHTAARSAENQRTAGAFAALLIARAGWEIIGKTTGLQRTSESTRA